MNLSELAAFICTKINQSETDDTAACKKFLTARAKMIWNVALWKDSLVSFAQTLNTSGYTTTSTWLPTKAVLLCPPIIERVIAARLDSRRLNVQRQEFYYNIDYDSFAKSGQVTEFVLLPPCVWEFETAQSVAVALAEAGDINTVVQADTLDANAIDVTRTALTLDNVVKGLATTARVDALEKGTTTGSVRLGVAYGITCVNNYFVALTFTTDYGSVTVAAGESGVVPSGPALTHIAFDPGYDFTGITGTNYGTATVDTHGDISYDGTATGALSITTVATMTAASQAVTKRQRVRLLQIPTESTTIRVLGKRAMPTFTNDLDTVPINNMENCLLAFAQADMLQRERQYGKAKELQQEAIGLLDQLKDMEVVQQTHHVTITPGDGFVSEWQFNSGAYYPLTF